MTRNEPFCFILCSELKNVSTRMWKMLHMLVIDAGRTMWPDEWDWLVWNSSHARAMYTCHEDGMTMLWFKHWPVQKGRVWCVLKRCGWTSTFQVAETAVYNLSSPIEKNYHLHGGSLQSNRSQNWTQISSTFKSLFLNINQWKHLNKSLIT